MVGRVERNMLSLDIESQISLIGKNRGFLEELIKSSCTPVWDQQGGRVAF